MKTTRLFKYLFFILCIVLVVFAIAKVKENGDFIGYVNAGNLVLSNGDIYSDMFNTWPPAFSIFSVPLAIMDSWSFVGVRVLWMGVLFVSFFYCIKVMLSVLRNETLTNKMVWQHLQTPYYLLAFFLCCRSFMDNLIYMQVNVVMLAACCYVLRQLPVKKITSGLLMGLSIGGKVFNIFLIPLFVIFRQWRMLLSAVGGIIMTLLLCIVVFGSEQSMMYFEHWDQHIASVPQTIIHRNQSMISAMVRLLSADNMEVNAFPSLAALDYSTIQRLYYMFFISCAILFVTVFYKAIYERHPVFVLHTFILVITLIPLLTPVAWKANYIYALPGFFFFSHYLHEKRVGRGVVICFITAGVALCLSNEAIIGRPAMYFLENCNVLAIGELLLASAIVWQMVEEKKNKYYQLKA